MAEVPHTHRFGPVGAPALLVLHGVTGHGGRFRRLAQRDLPGFRVIAPDLRGHGHSPRLPPWTLEQHAVDMLSVLDAEGLDSVPVVGHSYGGLVALHLARLAPQRVRELVLLDPAVSVPREEALAAAESAEVVRDSLTAAYDAQRHDWPTVADEVVEEEVAAHWAEVDGAWRPRFSPAAVATAWSEMCRTAPLPPPDTPTLLVRAARENYVGPGFVQGCRLSVRSFELVSLDCGHMLHLDAPVRVAELITGFVGGGRG